MENVMSLLCDKEITSLKRKKSNDILIFKTSVEGEHDMEKIASVFTADTRIKKWNVDLQDIDKVLRIESQQLQLAEIIEYVEKAGYICEELKD